MPIKVIFLLKKNGTKAKIKSKSKLLKAKCNETIPKITPASPNLFMDIALMAEVLASTRVNQKLMSK